MDPSLRVTLSTVALSSSLSWFLSFVVHVQYVFRFARFPDSEKFSGAWSYLGLDEDEESIQDYTHTLVGVVLSAVSVVYTLDVDDMSER